MHTDSAHIEICICNSPRVNPPNPRYTEMFVFAIGTHRFKLCQDFRLPPARLALQYTYICMNRYIDLCIQVVDIYIYLYLHVNIPIYTYIPIYIYKYKYVYIHVYI